MKRSCKPSGTDMFSLQVISRSINPLQANAREMKLTSSKNEYKYVNMLGVTYNVIAQSLMTYCGKRRNSDLLLIASGWVDE